MEHEEYKKRKWVKKGKKGMHKMSDGHMMKDSEMNGMMKKKKMMSY